MTPMPPMPPPQTRQVHPPLPNPDLYQPQIHQQPQTTTSELTSWNQISRSDGQVTVHGVTAEVRIFYVCTEIYPFLYVISRVTRRINR